MSAATVLVVDDDPVILRLLEVAFTLEGYEVLSAPDGSTCLQKAENERPDVVVVDVMMPGMSGLEVAERIHGWGETERPGVVLLSAKAQAQDVTAGLEVADDYVTKPFDPAALLNRVEALILQRRGARSEGD